MANPAQILRNVHRLDLDNPEGMSGVCDVLIEHGRIAAINPPATDAGAIDGKGGLLMPGLINAHFHSSVSHLKGSLPGLPLEIFMLYESPALEELRPSPREAYLRTMLGCIEMLHSGTTAVQDDCFFLPEPEPAIIDAVMQAYADSGMRASLALDQPELAEVDKLPFLRELAPRKLATDLTARPRLGMDDLLQLYAHLIERWHLACDGRLRAAVSCSAPQRVSPDYFAELDALSQRHDLAFFAHMLETKLQRVFGEECLGDRSLVRYTHDLGLLTERLNIIHAIWIDDADIALMADSGAVVAHNPNSNLRLGSGVMPFRELRDAGVPVCLGSDEAIADDAVNLWSVMKTAGMLHNLGHWDYDRWPQAREILQAATRAGGHAMRVPELGRLDVGAPADLILLDLTTTAFTPLNDLPRQLVHCELGGSVKLAMVAGEVVVADGSLTRVNEAALLAEAREIFAAKRPSLATARQAMAPYLPAYRVMYDRAAAREVGMQRRVQENGR